MCEVGFMSIHVYYPESREYQIRSGSKGWLHWCGQCVIPNLHVHVIWLQVISITTCESVKGKGTCLLLQQICCSTQTGQHEPCKGECCPLGTATLYIVN